MNTLQRCGRSAPVGLHPATSAAGVLVRRSSLSASFAKRCPRSSLRRPAPCRSSEQPQAPVVSDPLTTTQAQVEHSSNGSGPAPPPAGGAGPDALPEGQLVYKQPNDVERFWTRCRLAFALPWRRFKKDSVLVFKLEGDVSDQSRGRFDSGLSVPQVCAALEKAALDPRVKGVALEIGSLAAGWAKVQEIRRYITYFRQSGKFTMAYMKQASEKEYYLASACEEIYAPPTASLSLRGFAVSGTFLRGVLDKVGVEPQVKRIGKYKSAGDQLLRSDMSEPQAEQLGAILDDIYDEFLTTVGEARGKTREQVAAMLEEGIFDMQRFLEDGWVSGLRYEDEVLEDLKERTGGDKEKPLRKVELRRYSKVSPTAFGLPPRAGGKQRIVVLRTSGAIVGRASGATGAITPDGIIPTLRALAKDKTVAAVVLRVDSPGGDALASDLMWREIKNLGAKKPVVASMGDVAASGGYYMAMGCKTIVAEPLTITGSIGVVTGKFNLAELYEKIGYSKTILSKGRYAELLADNRSFSPEELLLFDRAADHAYESFRNKAAESRGMSVEAMQEVAQGRVWTGKAALQRGLVDALGGVNRAVSIARKLAEIPETDRVTIQEMGSKPSSPLSLLGVGASAASTSFLSGAAALLGSQYNAAAMASIPLSSGPEAATATVAAALASLALSQLPLLLQLQSGRVSYLMTDVDVTQLGSMSSIAGNMAPAAGSGDSSSFLEEGESGNSVIPFLESLWF